MAAQSSKGQTNLQRFLNSVTPSVPLHKIPKTWCRNVSSLWQSVPANYETINYFNLQDLWNQYKEWSAYGSGVEVCIGEESVEQYYVPYLSAFQIFTLNGPSDSRNVGISDIQFFERESPFKRIPFINKIEELAKTSPGLKSLRSIDISLDSWISVAWYPIYQIPARQDPKDLNTCFLTYHTLSPFIQGDVQKLGSNTNTASSSSDVLNWLIDEDNKNKIRLPPFAIATYKLTGTLWTNPECGDRQKLSSLFNAANLWLDRRNVCHPDFNFFIR